MNVKTVQDVVLPSELEDVDFEVSASDIYPGMIAEIQGMIADGENEARQKMLPHLFGDEVEGFTALQKKGMMEVANQSPIARVYLGRAMMVPQGAWEMALQPVSEEMSQENREARAEALEVARLWFTELLHMSVDYRPMSLRITKDEGNTYRL